MRFLNTISLLAISSSFKGCSGSSNTEAATKASPASNCVGGENGESCPSFPLSAQKFHPAFTSEEEHDERWLLANEVFERTEAEKADRRSRRLQETNPNDVVFDSFIAHKDSMTCSADKHTAPFNTQVRGVCLGGWQVLEPWITPSLFYQFLGKDKDSAALDTYTFCEVLGPVEGNKQLRRHWDTWVTEEIIQELAQVANVNSLRLPVGDWSFAPYGPYVGCTDGALDYIDKLMDWAHKYDVTVLIDIHSAKGSQNGFDNSGQARNVEWTSKFSKWPEGETQTFLVSLTQMYFNTLDTLIN